MGSSQEVKASATQKQKEICSLEDAEEREDKENFSSEKVDSKIEEMSSTSKGEIIETARQISQTERQISEIEMENQTIVIGDHDIDTSIAPETETKSDTKSEEDRSEFKSKSGLESISEAKSGSTFESKS